MGHYYSITIEGDTMTVAFGAPATNQLLVNDALGDMGMLTKMGLLMGGPVLKVNGPASLPVAFTIAHQVTHIYGAIAVFDPKLQGYVVAVSHNPDYAVGDLLQ